MRLKMMLIFVLVIMESAVFAASCNKWIIAQHDNWQEQIQEIDEKLDMLNNQKRKSQFNISKYRDQADRWQTDPSHQQDARYARAKADQEQQTISEIDERIQFLQDKKTAILKEHAGNS